MATLPTEAKVVDNVLNSHSPGNIQKQKVPSGRKVPTGLGQWDPTSNEWLEVHEETAAKRCKKSSTISRETKGKDKTTENKSSADKKCSSTSREVKEKESTIAKKASTCKKSTMTRKTKIETQKKTAITKAA